MSAQDMPDLAFTHMEAWYLHQLADMIERRLEAAGTGTYTWCPTWWKHPEAIARLEALWRAWEICRAEDGEAPSRWFWQHCDPMLAVLMDAKRGPMSDCKPDEHRKYTTAKHLPKVPAPQGFWGPEHTADVANVA